VKSVPWWVWALGIGGIGYLLYKTMSGVNKAVTGATGAVAQGIADIWLSLPYVGLGTGQQILGNVLLPSGTLVPLNSLSRGQIRQDNNTPPNVYANVNGTIYQLSASNAQGNYPGALVGPAPGA
jgi:hypothetical protein